jgi:hypothetical protein
MTTFLRHLLDDAMARYLASFDDQDPVNNDADDERTAQLLHDVVTADEDTTLDLALSTRDTAQLAALRARFHRCTVCAVELDEWGRCPAGHNYSE